MNDLRSQKTPIESLFIEATEKFRSNLKTMYSVPVCGTPAPGRGPEATPTPSPARALPSVCPTGGSHPAFPQNGNIHVGYKDLMENYQIVVSNLAAERGEKDTNLVLNLFQSLLDEFTRGYTKNDFEPPKVGAAALGSGGPLCSARRFGEGYPQGAPAQTWPFCSLTAEQSSEEKAEAGTRCEYVCSRVRAHSGKHVFSHPALRDPHPEMPREASPRGGPLPAQPPPLPPRCCSTTGTCSSATK